MRHFADRLNDACREKGAPICVGLDPVVERLPDGVTLEDYCLGVVDAVADHVPCLKPQLACFERHGVEGLETYERVVERCHRHGLLVIADAKRGDIGISSAHYATALLTGAYAADAMTVSPYLGVDALQPFLDTAAAHGGGLFALVRTSNPGSDEVQGMRLEDGRTVAEAVADMLARAGSGHVGATSGYSLLGAVVGATKPQDAQRLRERMPQQIFLVPGFGAQGGTAEDVRACFRSDGTGALITASRSVIYAYEKQPDRRWQQVVADAAAAFGGEIAGILK